jgi:hypothetical protein
MEAAYKNRLALTGNRSGEVIKEPQTTQNHKGFQKEAYIEMC